MLDFNRLLTQAQVDEIEGRCNKHIAEARPVCCHVVFRDTGTQLKEWQSEHLQSALFRYLAQAASYGILWASWQCPFAIRASAGTCE